MNPAEDLCVKTFLLTTESVCKIHLSNMLGKMTTLQVLIQ